MKKNVMMRVASALLVAVLLSTCAISGTFAKYVTTASGTDTARVAKWGVTITANGTTFAEEYDTDDGAFTEAKSVISTEKVVAPGTNGNMTSMTLAGTPEVAVRVTYTADIDISDNWLAGTPSQFYFPIIVYINGVAYSAEGTGCADANAFETYLENKIAAYSNDYPAGTNLSTVTGDSLEITWEWPFETGNDNLDTDLGNQAAAANPATITVTVNTTVTQID